MQQAPVKPVRAVGEAVGEPGGGGYRTVCSSGWSPKDAVGTELTVAVRLWGVGVFHKKAEEERRKNAGKGNPEGEAVILRDPPVRVTLVEDEGPQHPPLR